MTLDEAISHAEEVAEEKESEAQDLEYSRLDWKYEANKCSKCAEEHRQLAEWLKELQKLKEQTKWIPWSERMPNKNGAYLVTTENCIGKHIKVLDYANDLYKIDEYDFIDKKGMAGWYYLDAEYGFIEVENVLAWMPLPQPYKAESEDKE